MPMSRMDVQGIVVHGQPSPDFFGALLGSKWTGPIYVMEGRPTLAGASETVPALVTSGRAPILISDNMVAYCMWKGFVQAAVVAYWRRAEGGLICPVGALGVAICAAYHRLPVVGLPAAQAREPSATDEAALLEFLGHRVAADGVDEFNPAADLVPERWISEIRDREKSLPTPEEARHD